MKSSWETHKGKRYFFARYTDLDIEGVKKEVPEVEEVVKREPLESVLLLIDTKGTVISPDALVYFKNTSKNSKPYMKKVAIMGMTGVRQLIVDLIVKFAGIENLKAFDDAESARDWLVQ